MEFEIAEGSDGWLFLTRGQHKVIDLYRAESAFTPEMAEAWVRLLSQRTDRLKAMGIDYTHLAVPDKLTLLNRHYSEALENPSGSPILQLVDGYKDRLSGFLNAVPVMSRGIDNYQVFWKTDQHWTAWGCYMAYQLVCNRLEIPTNRELLRYPFSEEEAVLGFGRYDRNLPSETVRTYTLDRYSKRVYANQVVRYRENHNLEALAGCLAEEALADTQGEVYSDHRRLTTLRTLSEELSEQTGSHVIYRNESADAMDKCIVLFGDSFADHRSQLLTGMLSETVREVHFIWSQSIDYEYLRQIRPDIVISEGSETGMTQVPVDEGQVSQWADERIRRLESARQRVNDEALATTLLSKPDDSAQRTLLLDSERYHLEPPVMVQECDRAVHQELEMQSNPVSLVNMENPRVYFNGERCLLRTANGRRVFAYNVDAEREAYLMQQDYQRLPGKSFLLAPSTGAHCYYHWMLDVLPRLGLLERQGISLDSIDQFLVREIRSSFQIETLQRLGIDRSRIFETVDRQYLHCENLMHIDLENRINMKMHRFIPLWMKQQFLTGARGDPLESAEERQQAVESGAGGSRAVEEILANAGGRLRLYIGRPEGVRRGILNEDQIKPILEAAGFTMVYMEGMSVADQAVLLSHADALMAPHGGALTNMVFCKPGIPVIEILSRHVYPYFYGLASLCGHRYHAILQEPEKDIGRLVNVRLARAQGSADVQKQTRGQSFNVDVTAVEAMMARLQASG